MLAAGHFRQHLPGDAGFQLAEELHFRRCAGIDAEEFQRRAVGASYPTLAVHDDDAIGSGDHHGIENICQASRPVLRLMTAGNVADQSDRQPLIRLTEGFSLDPEHLRTSFCLDGDLKRRQPGTGFEQTLKILEKPGAIIRREGLAEVSQSEPTAIALVASRTEATGPMQKVPFAVKAPVADPSFQAAFPKDRFDRRHGEPAFLPSMDKVERQNISQRKYFDIAGFVVDFE